MSFTAPYNPFSHWMNWKDVYVTFDSMEVMKKSAVSGEPESLGHFDGGRLSWPLFMQMMSGMMQYSAVETGFNEPLLRPDSMEKLAKHLQAHDESSFILKCDNLRVNFTAVDKMSEAASNARSLWTDAAKMWMPYASDHLDAMRDAADEMHQSAVKRSMPMFPSDTIDLGEAASHLANWFKLMEPLQKGFQAGR